MIKQRKNKERVIAMLEMAKSKETVKTGYEQYMDKNVFIRTVTHHYSGHVTSVDGLSLTMDQAAWIADDGRYFEDLFKDPDRFNEDEPYLNPVSISLYAILDITVIPKLITVAK